MKVVMKFGGTSVRDGIRIKHVAEIIRKYYQEGKKLVVVVSALSGVTDSLIDATDIAERGNRRLIPSFIRKLSKTHGEAAKVAIKDKSVLSRTIGDLDRSLSELERALTGISYLRELTPRSHDYVSSFGERLSAPILCGALQDVGLKARWLTGGEAGLTTDAHFGEARPLMKVTRQRVREILEPLIKDGIIPVVTGYIASTQDGVITTLGRGGSDYTASLLGTALNVDEVWIWSDVSGLMTADPKIVLSAKTLPSISFSEAIEMAYFGAKVVHPKALEPAMEGGITVRIKNTLDPEGPGTLIASEQQVKRKGIVKAVTLIKDVALVTVAGTGMMGAPGVAARVFDILGKNHVNVLMISQGSSEANISFTIPRKDLKKAVSALKQTLLGGDVVERISSEDDICIVAAVGAGMEGTPGVAARVFKAVAEQRVNVRMIAQGSSELNISFVVKEVDGSKAVNALHREFQLHRLAP